MANGVAIVTDTTACIPQDRVKEYSIEVVPVELILDNKAYRDGIDITPAEFYSRLRRAQRVPTTSGSVPGPYLEAYRRASQRANSIVCITESSKFSGMFNSARVAKSMAQKELPGVKVEVFECSSAAAGQGLVALAAARAAASGKNLTQVVEVVKSLMHRVYLFASLDTLHYLVKGGVCPKPLLW